MAKILVIYYTKSGNTEKMAQKVVEGMQTVDGTYVQLKNLGDVDVKELLDYDAIMIGCPVYYGMPPYEVKEMIDRSVVFHGQLKGKLGGAFSSSGNVGGGNETTCLDILHVWLIHGMLVMGDSVGDHYGPVSVGAPDDRGNKVCFNYGKLFAETAKSIFG